MPSQRAYNASSTAGEKPTLNLDMHAGFQGRNRRLAMPSVLSTAMTKVGAAPTDTVDSGNLQHGQLC